MRRKQVNHLRRSLLFLLLAGAARAAVAQSGAATAQNAGAQSASQNAAAQNAPRQNAAAAPTAPIKGNSEIMVVLGTATPVPLAESQRSVEILPVKAESLAAESPQDFLRGDSSVFLEERGAGGGQADLVLRGGSFEQTLVLVNGFRINDAQTSHHNLDLPVPLEAMESIQVLEGAGSTLHGVDALSGVVDFLTAAPDHDSMFLRGGEGSLRGERGDAAGWGDARASGAGARPRSGIFRRGLWPHRHTSLRHTRPAAHNRR